MPKSYPEVHLDALREIANIGSGTAATALSSMLGRPVDISVPKAPDRPMPKSPP
jgi:chemotaxis protein CheC